MQFERVRRSSKEVSCEQPGTLLPHTHLRELVRQRVNARRLVRRALSKPGCVDVFRLLLGLPIVRCLSGLSTYLLLRELAVSRETWSEQLRLLLSRLRGDSAVRRASRRGYRVRAVVRLRLTGCILTSFCVVGLCGWGRCTRRGVEAFGVREGRFPLRSASRGLCRIHRGASWRHCLQKYARDSPMKR